MKFKVGDKAWFQGKIGMGNDTHYAEPIEVTIGNFSRYESKDTALVQFPARSWWVYVDQLTPFTPQPSEFKVGDRVEILNNKGFDEGVVLGPGKYPYENCGFTSVNVAGKGPHNFYTTNLRLLSPQSPQPQTTEPKEDTMKPYAVIIHDLSANAAAAIFGYYTTEAEAKEAAELQVASRRSSLTAKNYFAITIVNTKTGKLVGSVVDAPPQVEWNKE